MLAFLTLLVGVALPVWVLFLLLRRGKRQLDAAIAYRHVASELGLDVDTRGVSVHGHLDDDRLWVGEVMVGHGQDRRTAIWGVLDLERPLGLGLQVRRRGLSERVFRRGRAPGVELGDPFDQRFELRGDSAPRVRALVGDPGVKAALGGLMARWPDVVVTDSSVRVHLKAHETDPERLMDLVERMRNLARTLSEARRAVGVPDALTSVVTAWAGIDDLELEPWLPALKGQLEGREVLVTIHRVDRGYRAELRLMLEPPRELGLRVRPQTGPDGYWSVGQDIQFDDAAFDRAYVVKGWDPDRVRDHLTPQVREALLAVQTVNLMLDDRRLVLRGLSTDVRTVREALRDATRIADALGW